jgi:general secretion pathway protein D
MMKSLRPACVALCLLALTGVGFAQSSETSSTEHQENGVPFSRLIATVAKKTGKKFVVDPRVRGDAVLVGQDPASIGYGDLLAILQVYGFAAIEFGGYVRVVPDAIVRQLPLPQVSGKETRPDAEFASQVIALKNVPAAHLVPILRPLMPPVGHLAALPCVNMLIIVDTFANIRRMDALIASLDVGTPFKPEKCEVRDSAGTAPR